MNDRINGFNKPSECPVCKAEDTSFLFQVDGFDVWHCGQCSASFVWEMPSEGELKNFFDSPDRFESGLKGGYDAYDQQTEGTIPFVENILISLAEGKAGKSVLDVGCGYGTHLGLANKLGWECFGIELSDHAREVALKRHGDYAFIKSDVSELIPHEFDLVLMLDVIEHLPDPYVLFYELFAKGAIRKNTTIIVSTPNAQSKEAVNKKEAWEYMHPPSHLLYYSAESIYQFFKRLKFKNIEISGQYQTEESVEANESTDFSRNDKVSGYSGLIVKASGSDFTQFMQERYVPGTWSVLAEYEHMPRYMLAKKHCVGKKVLDFGCGTGYGSKIISQVATHVTALDIDQEALQWARSTHKAENLEFIRSKTLGEELASNSFDVIVNFEMIEHVDQELQKRCLKQFSRLLKDDGLLLISTPNPDVTAEYGDNPYHIHEMTKDEFEAFLKEALGYVSMLEQFINPAVLIQGQSSEMDRISIGNPRPAAYIAFASNSEIQGLKGMEYVDSNYDFVGEELRNAARLQKAQFEAHQYEHKMHNSIQTQSSLHAEIDSRRAEVVSLHAEIDSRRAEVVSLHAEVVSLHAEVVSLHAEVSQFRLSRVFRLKDTWDTAPFGIRKFLKLAYLVGGGVIPAGIKKILTPLILRLRTGKSQFLDPDSLLEPDGENPRVLHVVANFFLGGSSRLIADIVHASSDQYHHTVLTSAAPEDPVYPDIPVYVSPVGVDPKVVNAFIDKHSPDLVHIHYWGECDEPWYNAVYQLVKDRDCKIVENINTPVAPYVGDAIDRYVYVSDYVKDNFGHDSEKSETVYPGSNFELFNRENIEDIADNCIGMVYRLENDKLNLDSIHPFIEVVKRRPQTKVIIVGGGTNLLAYKKACKKAGVLEAFTFTGTVPYESLPGWYSKFSIFVAPVWKESFGQVSPFAMSMGLPVVGYNIGAISEIIGTDKLLAEPGDCDQLADITVKLLDDREARLKIGKDNQRRAREKFSIQEMTDSYKRIYADLLEMKR